jgi:hypothetical protein
LYLLKIRERSIVQPGYYNPDTHLFILADIENFESQINELKNAVKILYDADNNERRQYGNDVKVPG